jgi:hypothetical protein
VPVIATCNEPLWFEVERCSDTGGSAARPMLADSHSDLCFSQLVKVEANEYKRVCIENAQWVCQPTANNSNFKSLCPSTSTDGHLGAHPDESLWFYVGFEDHNVLSSMKLMHVLAATALLDVSIAFCV